MATVPSDLFCAIPFTPNWSATALVVSRKLTPCTMPEMVISRCLRCCRFVMCSSLLSGQRNENCFLFHNALCKAVMREHWHLCCRKCQHLGQSLKFNKNLTFFGVTNTGVCAF